MVIMMRIKDEGRGGIKGTRISESEERWVGSSAVDGQWATIAREKTFGWERMNSSQMMCNININNNKKKSMAKPRQCWRWNEWTPRLLLLSTVIIIASINERNHWRYYRLATDRRAFRLRAEEDNCWKLLTCQFRVNWRIEVITRVIVNYCISMEKRGEEGFVVRSRRKVTSCSKAKAYLSEFKEVEEFFCKGCHGNSRYVNGVELATRDDHDGQNRDTRLDMDSGETGEA